MAKHLLLLLIVAGLVLLMVDIYQTWEPVENLPPLAAHYAANGDEELGSQNLVTAIVVSYRGLDTLGEVAVLFLIAAIVGYFLSGGTQPVSNRAPSELLETASRFLLPVLLLTGVSIFVNGHLTPGGGFQGGAVMASGALLFMLGNPKASLSHHMLGVLESLSGITFVLIGLLGLILAGGFLDPRILPAGVFGTLLSAGAIPLIYSLIGLKVGAELSGIMSSMQKAGEEA
jgi:multicomponent Na+:H+ antiporter subunit B